MGSGVVISMAFGLADMSMGEYEGVTGLEWTLVDLWDDDANGVRGDAAATARTGEASAMGNASGDASDAMGTAPAPEPAGEGLVRALDAEGRVGTLNGVATGGLCRGGGVLTSASRGGVGVETSDGRREGDRGAAPLGSSYVAASSNFDGTADLESSGMLSLVSTTLPSDSVTWACVLMSDAWK